MSEIERIDGVQFISSLKFDDSGLIPAIIQDERDQTVLMLGYMNVHSLQLTLETGKVTFWSRSRKQLWTKGETSGNFLQVKEIFTDCDRDTLLIRAQAWGPTCHTAKRSCFSWKMEP